jgi:uncharacterized membrane protein
MVIVPHEGERFTEFYILGLGGNASGYSTELRLKEKASVTIGLVNHEYKTINYNIEIWLVNQTTFFNSSTNEEETVYHNFWFIDKITTTLNHFQIEIEQPWQSQWEYNYTFSINHNGTFKLAFLLYTQPTDQYIVDMDYSELALEKIDSENTTAYRTLYLWLKT